MRPDHQRIWSPAPADPSGTLMSVAEKFERQLGPVYGHPPPVAVEAREFRLRLTTAMGRVSGPADKV